MGRKPKTTRVPHETADRDTTADADVESHSGNAPLRANETPRISAPCRVTFHHTRKRLADMDGLSIKAVLDGLVHAGVFPVDTPEFVSEIRHTQAKGSDEITIITIETEE